VNFRAATYCLHQNKNKKNNVDFMAKESKEAYVRVPVRVLMKLGRKKKTERKKEIDEALMINGDADDALLHVDQMVKVQK